MTQAPTFPHEPQDSYALPLSRMAITAFILSFLLGPLGIVLGIFGILYTAPGVARGRGFAVAAIPIGLVNILVVTCAGLAYMGIPMGIQQQAIFNLLKSPIEEVDQKASDVYPHLSEALTANVSEAEFAEWLRNAIQQHGSLPMNVNFGSLQTLTDANGSYIWIQRVQAPFPNSETTIPIDYAFGFFRMQLVIQNAAVDGVWINPDTAPAIDTGATATAESLDDSTLENTAPNE
jgi:hypothetical protein